MPSLGNGIFSDIESAVTASVAAQRALGALPLDTRRRMIEAMRAASLQANEALAAEAVAETGLGNLKDKQVKNALVAIKTPGVEDIEPYAFSDEHGLTLTERAPYGVIAAITPVTNPTSTIICNSLGMVAAGNTVVFNVHPNAKAVSCHLIALLNEAIVRAGGPQNTLAAIAAPTIESAGELMRHPRVALLVVTGGPGVVKAAMASGKKAICAGPAIRLPWWTRRRTSPRLAGTSWTARASTTTWSASARRKSWRLPPSRIGSSRRCGRRAPSS